MEGTFFIGILLLQCFLLFSPVQAQDFKPEKFDKSLLNESLAEQEILREEMEQIRLEMQRIMEEIKLAMMQIPFLSHPNIRYNSLEE